METKDLGHLAHIVAYDAENHITVPAGITMHTNQLVASQAWVTTALGSYALSSSLGSYVPTSRKITINGTEYDLSADRSWNITSMIYPSAGIALSTGSAWGSSITNNSANWNTAYGWGNHASAGYLTGITSTQVTTALGFTPYNSTNPSGYITGINSSMVTNALGYTPVKDLGQQVNVGSLNNLDGRYMVNLDGYGPINGYGGPDGAYNAGLIGIGNSGRGHQIYMPYDSANLYVRRGQNGWQAWSRFLNTIEDSYPSNMNQYVRTTDSPTFRTIYSSAGYSFVANGYNNNGGFAMNNAGTYWGMMWNYSSNDWRLGWSNQVSQVGWNLRWDASGNVFVNNQISANSLNIADGNVELYKSVTVDMSGGAYSQSNYYPVIIGVPTSGVTIQIQNNLNSNVPSWSTHPGGFSINLIWTTNGSGWGTTSINRSILQWQERFTNVTICGGISQLGTSSEEVVWLRGGGVYYFIFSRNLSATPYSSTYTNPYGTESAGVSSSVVNSPWNVSVGRMSYGEVYSSGDVIAYSDARSKSNVRPIQNALNKVINSKGVIYDRIDNNTKDNIGFIAQELESEIPQLVFTDDNGFKSVKYQNMVAVLTEAIKEQQGQIEELKSIINGITK